MCMCIKINVQCQLIEYKDNFLIIHVYSGKHKANKYICYDAILSVLNTVMILTMTLLL